MKWLRTLVLFDKGNVVSSGDWRTLHEAYVRAIKRVEHPMGAGKLTLRRKAADEKTGKLKRNGVSPLRTQFLRSLVDDEHWKKEEAFKIAEPSKEPNIRLYPGLDTHHEQITSEFGAFDFITTTPSGMRVAIEWETGNISSSHRSMNKLAIALGAGEIQAGVLIVPSRSLYEHLTDRIGNIGELSPYLPMWSGLSSTVENGLFAVTVVEHDELSSDPSLPYLKTGKDGNAAKAKQTRQAAGRKLASAGVKKAAAKRAPKPRKPAG